MRTATVANSEFPIEGGWLAAIAGAVGVLTTGVLAWLGQRLIGKAAWKTAVDAQTNAFIDQLQEERREYQAIIAQMRKEWAEDKIAAAARDAQLSGEIINLTQTVESLKALLRRAGIPVPPARSIEGTFMVLEQEGLDDDDA